MKKLAIYLILTVVLTASVIGQQRQTSIQASSSAISLPAASGPSSFTYQGKLNFNSIPANGQFDFTVYLCDRPDPVDEPVEKCVDSREIDSVAVAGGIFTIHLDFDPAKFNEYDSLYLDIQVRQSGTPDAFTALKPRQQIDSTPYAQNALSANALNCSNCITNGQIVSVDAAKVNGKVASASVADTAANATNAQNAANATFAATAQNALNAVDLTTNQTVGGNKSFTGVLSGNGSGLLNVPGTLKWNVSPGGSLQLQSNNGYVLTNTTVATVTLPASPNFGDVVRVMEKGAGGFTVAMNQGQSILDWATTHQETLWTRQYSVIASTNTNLWQAVASSADGTKLAAVEYPGYIVKSASSGQTWTLSLSDAVRNYTCIASSSDGTKLIAGVEGGYLYTSTDSGANWTARYTDANRSWYSVAMSSDGSKLYAADINGVYVSTNGGVNWTIRKTLPNHVGRIASSADGTKLVLAENLGYLYTSTDSGVTWTPRINDATRDWVSVALSADGSMLIAAAYGQKLVYVSSNSGATWTSKLSGKRWVSVSASADGLRMAAVANQYDSGCCTHDAGELDISYDGGNSWTPTSTGTNWTAVAVSGNGNRVSAAMADNSLNKLYSGPVTTQTFVDTIMGVKDSAVELVYIGNNQFAMVSSNGMTIPPHTY